MAIHAGGASPPATRVLVAEDEFLLAMELQDLLENSGWCVLGPAATVAQALACIERESPELALLDVNLRGRLVTPVVAALRARNVPFLVVSGYGRNQLQEAALGEAAALPKPIDHDQLLHALDQVLETSSSN